MTMYLKAERELIPYAEEKATISLKEVRATMFLQEVKVMMFSREAKEMTQLSTTWEMVMTKLLEVRVRIPYTLLV